MSKTNTEVKVKMKNILIVSGHTDLEHDSVANKIILETLHNQLPDAEFDYLDRLYPDFHIDVKAEQEKLVKANIIVFQYPIFWYAMPSLLHRWVEKTFVHGFSHGSKGKSLQGKKLIASFTTGAPESFFAGEGIDHLLYPIHGICNLCGMQFKGHVYTGGVSYQLRTDEASLAQIKAKALEHAENVVNLIKSI